VPTYVLDTAAIISIEKESVQLGVSASEVFRRMTDLTVAGDLICPPIVVSECKKYGGEDEGTNWLRLAVANFNDTSQHYSFLDAAMDCCPEMFDEDDPEENPQLVVLALALYRKNKGQDVVIVTGDWVNQPAVRALGHSAANATVLAISVPQFILSL
jgi:hypothetical protein